MEECFSKVTNAIVFEKVEEKILLFFYTTDNIVFVPEVLTVLFRILKLVPLISSTEIRQEIVTAAGYIVNCKNSIGGIFR